MIAQYFKPTRVGENLYSEGNEYSISNWIIPETESVPGLRNWHHYPKPELAYRGITGLSEKDKKKEKDTKQNSQLVAASAYRLQRQQWVSVSWLKTKDTVSDH